MERLHVCLHLGLKREREKKKINNDSIILKFENRIWFISKIVNIEGFDNYVLGLGQVKKDKSSADENAVSSSSTQERQSPVNSNDLEWDNDFVSAEINTSDTAQLLAAEMAIQKTASR